MRSITITLASMIAFFVSGDVSRDQDSKPAPWPVASPADVASMDATLKSLYDVISEPAGQARNWDRMRSLFIPKAQLTVASHDREGRVRPVVMSVDDYIKRASNPRAGLFFEREIARSVDAFGDIAQVFSTYEIRESAADERPFTRGINSIQLMKDEARWWIVSILWCQETDANPLPERYLRAGAESRR